MSRSGVRFPEAAPQVSPRPRRSGRRVLVSPPARTDRHTAMCGGTRGVGVRVPRQIDVVPGQGAELFGSGAGEQGEHDVGAHPGALGGSEHGVGLREGDSAT